MGSESYTTFTPATFPRRPKNSNLLTEVRYYLQLWYYRYEVTTPLYVMTEREKFTFNLVVLSFFALLFSASYYYLPGTLKMSGQRLAYYFTGSRTPFMQTLDVAMTHAPLTTVAGSMNTTTLVLTP